MTKAEASMTLMVPVFGITIRANDRRRLIGRIETQSSDPRPEFVNVEAACGLWLLHCFFDDCHQLTLQRPMVPRRPLGQALHNIIGSILD